jgi:hypothetical protein
MGRYWFSRVFITSLDAWRCTPPPSFSSWIIRHRSKKLDVFLISQIIGYGIEVTHVRQTKNGFTAYPNISRRTAEHNFNS